MNEALPELPLVRFLLQKKSGIYTLPRNRAIIITSDESKVLAGWGMFDIAEIEKSFQPDKSLTEEQNVIELEAFKYNLFCAMIETINNASKSSKDSVVMDSSTIGETD